MSNQEAIALLRNLEDSLDSYCELSEEGKTAFRMAIEALSSSEFPNSSDTDTISRQAAIDAIRDMQAFEDDNGQPYLYLYDVMAVFTDEEELPPIQPEPHWIPVTEGLPELRHDVLLTVFFHERWNVAEGYRQDGEFMFWNNGRLDSVLDEENRVIAWMPKPEPFKGVTE